mgnify:CR=1 FL=1|jgi:hypothetical protein
MSYATHGANKLDVEISGDGACKSVQPPLQISVGLSRKMTMIGLIGGLWYEGCNHSLNLRNRFRYNLSFMVLAIRATTKS